MSMTGPMNIPPQVLMAIVQALQNNPATNTPAPPKGSHIMPAQVIMRQRMQNLLGGQQQQQPPTAQQPQQPLPPSAGQMSPGQWPQAIHQLMQILSGKAGPV